MVNHQEVYLKVLVSKLYYYSYTTRENSILLEYSIIIQTNTWTNLN
jgi:hypothetical protein